MHDMSNTRKEITARLGFAAGNGAKTRMDRSDGNYFLITAMVDNAPTGERSFDTKAEAEYYGKQMLEATKKANPKAKSVKVSLMEVVNMSPQAPFKTLSSRPGAKSSFGRAEDVYRLLETTPSSYNNAKKLDALATEAMRLADITPAGKDVSLHELAEMVGQDLEGDRSRAARPGVKAKFAKPQFRTKKLHNGYIAVEVNQGNGWERYDTTHEESWNGIEEYERGYQKAYDQGLRYSGGSWRIPSTNAARPGAKAAFAASLAEIKAWAQALKKEGQLSQKVQKANERKNPTEYDITSATEARVFLGLSDAVQRGDKMLVRKLLGEAKREISNVVFREGVPQALIAWASSTTASRPGAKTRMTREQTEEQKAGLKIMSAADPAVGAKIAKLIKEGKPQDQAVAIALDMKRRGEL